MIPRLPVNVEEQARVLGALQRRRGIKQASHLLRAILSWILCQRSLRQLGVWAVLLGIADLSDTAWRKRLAKCGDWLNWLLQEALGGAGESRDGRVLLVDGTDLLPPGGTGKQGWLVQITYDIRAGALVDIRVGDAHLAETLLGLPLGKGDVLLNDRGFTRRAGIVAVANQQAQQLGRWSQTGATLQKEDGTALCVDDWLDSIEAECSIAERSGRCVRASEVVPLRVLALRLPPEQAKKAQERLQKLAKRKGRKLRESTFKRAGWVILISTLPTEYSAIELFWLYRSRWQIERLIKAMKQLLPLVQLRSDQPELIRTTLLAWVLIWAWQEEAVQAIVQQLQQTCGTPEQLREEYLQLVQLWEAEEGKPLEEDHPLSVVANPQLPTYLSSPQPAPSAPSRWVISCCSVQWMQAVVQGQWSWKHMLASLPRLARFFCPSPRRRRSQRFQLEAWLRFRLAKSPLFSSG
jgi:Transposase DDE domain